MKKLLNLVLKLFGLKNYKYCLIIDTFDNKVYSVNKKVYFCKKFNNICYKILKINKQDVLNVQDVPKFKMIICFNKINEFMKEIEELNSGLLKAIIKMMDFNDKLYDKLNINLEDYI